MSIDFAPLDVRGSDRDRLIDFLTSHEYPFHVVARPDRARIEHAIAEGAYDDEDHQALWVRRDGQTVGVVVLEDLSEDAPLFDLRLATEARGQGLGVPVLRALTDWVFTTFPAVDRFEGQTREDNTAMRKTFLRAGFLKEAHYRRGWPVQGGEPLASVAYAILRDDWRTGTTTSFVWEDLTV
ncbi:MAG: GNAT family N-acetyltransferase [Cellulomonadaceae bacterium]